MRPSKTEYYLEIAKTVATRSTCLKRHYGAILVKNDMIVATGYNGAPKGDKACTDRGECWKEAGLRPHNYKVAIEHGCEHGCCLAVHAEQNLMIKARPEDLNDGDVYLAEITGRTAIPCNTCERMLKQAGVRRIITEEGTIDYGEEQDRR